MIAPERARTSARVEVGDTNLPSDLVEAYLNREEKESRRHLKAVILFLAPEKRVQPTFIDAYGVAPGVLLSHFFRWDSNGSDDNGWIYQSKEQLMGKVKGTGMPDRQIRRARKTLVDAGVLEEDLRPGIPQRLFYRVNLAQVLGLVQPSTARELAELEAAYLDRRADDAFVCDGEFCFGCDECESWIRGEDGPLDDDEPLIEDVPLDWLPEDFVPTLNLDSNRSTGEPITRSTGEPITRSTGDPHKQRVTRREELSETPPSRWQTPAFAEAATTFKREKEEPAATSPPSVQDSPGVGLAREAYATPSPVITTHVPTQTVRGLLEPGGKLHDLVDDALEYGVEGPALMARSVATRLGGESEDYLTEVTAVLAELATNEREVA